ncbi:Rv3235 family protein [Cutibacterium namnetense]|uniref:Rv3235 family protein n=1 Tax=Cutibacterium namnetense TaxID=1574624 RepID=UPI00254FB8E9|nr:Rv3235 family protein [Cutibacterium namnetense]
MTTTPSPISLDSALIDHSGIFLELDRDWWPDELCVVSSAPTLCRDGDDSQASYEAARLTRAVHIIIVETMAGRRPMSQLVKASSTRAVATMRRWPRGPGWSRMLLVGEPRVSYDSSQVDGVGLLDLRGRRLPLATRLVLEDRAWRLDAVELVLNPKVATLLTSKKITCETVGLG